MSASALHSALLGRQRGGNRLTLLSCDRTTATLDEQAVSTVVTSARRGGEVVVCDLPRHQNESSRAVLDRADLTVVVVPAEVRACAAARQVVTQLLDKTAHAMVLVRGPAPGGLRADDVAKAVGLPLLSVMKSEPRLAGSLEGGRPPDRSRGPLAAAAAVAFGALCGVDDAR